MLNASQIFLSGLIYAAGVSAAQVRSHTVRQGESMWSIARQYGISLEELISMNPQIENPNLIYPGQKLVIGNTPQTPGPQVFEEQALELINKERTTRGLNALRQNPQVMSVARRKSEDMLNENYFSHTSPTYGSPFDMLKSFGVTFTAAAENIAKGQKTPAAVVVSWMNSPPHRSNILNSDFTDAGVGYVAGNGTTYWTLLLIRP